MKFFFHDNSADAHDGPSAIVFDDISGAFVLLAIGLISSLIVFCLEFWKYDFHSLIW